MRQILCGNRATIAENFNVRMPDGTIGESMLDQIQ